MLIILKKIKWIYIWIYYMDMDILYFQNFLFFKLGMNNKMIRKYIIALLLLPIYRSSCDMHACYTQSISKRIA